MVSVTPLLMLVITAGVAQAMGHTEQPQSAQPRTRWLKVKRNTDGAPASGKKFEAYDGVSLIDRYENSV